MLLRGHGYAFDERRRVRQVEREHAQSCDHVLQVLRIDFVERVSRRVVVVEVIPAIEDRFEAGYACDLPLADVRADRPLRAPQDRCAER